MLTSEDVKAQAKALGFDLCGVAPAAAFPELGRLAEWLDRGYAGEMGYMARTAATRADVRRFLPSARSVVMVATNYHVGGRASIEMADPARARIARYARGDDYHDVLPERLDRLVDWMRERAGAFEARRFVDTAPVQERVYAQHAGLGWIGKNSCLINPEVGSWTFLGGIATSLELPPDPPAVDQCGTCTLCLEACPTGAIIDPGMVDATRCLSYLTIELKGAIPEPLRASVGRHVFGCDVCQDVCPWNATALVSTEPAWQARASFDEPRLLDLWRRSDAELAEVVEGSALTRPKLRGLRRNLAVALGNASGDAGDEAGAGLEQDRPDSSIADPMVDAHVQWARRRLRHGPAE